MKIAYILFIAAIDILIYTVLYMKVNKGRKIGAVLWGLIGFATVAIACHADFFKLGFLLPFDELLMVLLWSIAAAVAHLISVFYVERFKESNWLKREKMSFVAGTLAFTRMSLYVGAFLVQCLIITSIV